jgi:pimeloyl-ACP methyl ester carboxylesterase
MNSPKRRRWPWIAAALVTLVAAWHLINRHYPEEEQKLRRQLREVVQRKFPEQARDYSRKMGLLRFDENRDLPGGADIDGESVVLIHGLDDPGKVWAVLAPRLAQEGFTVWLMEYPNDQPIVESARFLFAELEKLSRDGIRRISIVAHSMGGLVSREMLSAPDIDYPRAAASGQVPAVAALIMVGTPNHGSELARLRVFSEIRDHLALLARGRFSWLGTIFDGAGEAKIDLLPGSRFLTELNARPQPEGIAMLTIAGAMSPWQESDINRWRDSLGQKMPGERQGQLDAIGSYLISMSRGLGDGLVTVESTRLEGVPHRTVEGTHLSMIRNVAESSSRTPPAVPIVVDRLKADK